MKKEAHQRTYETFLKYVVVPKKSFMKNAVYLFFFVFGYSIYAQNGYWQQAVDYTIDAKVDDVNDALDGKETLIYTNNSPDTLKVLFFHLYWNAMKKGTSANQKLGVFNSIEGDSSDDDYGQIDVLSVNINGEIIPMKVFETIGQVPLKQALVPGLTLRLRWCFVLKFQVASTVAEKTMLQEPTIPLRNGTLKCADTTVRGGIPILISGGNSLELMVNLR